MDISLIDKNLAVDKTIDKEGLSFYDIDSEPFRIYGVKRYGDNYWRLDPEVALATSPGVYRLGSNTAGGRIRFVTNSKRVALIATYSDSYQASHFPPTGTTGFDIYVGKRYHATFVPPVTMPNKAYESVMSFESSEERLVTINMPLYSSPTKVYIGLDDGATLKRAKDYTVEKPVVYYGSSITQGGCASHAGMSYEGIISRKLDINFINLGFSGNGKAEPVIADYIAGLDMSAFVYDYDHNAPTVEYLAATHENMFLKIREKHPDMPIIMVSRPNYAPGVCDDRFAVIKRTYDNAVKRGDKNVYIYHGRQFFADSEEWCEATVDACHPTDYGFHIMGEKLCPIIAEVLGLKM